MDDPVDEIVFQEKSVFLANFIELVRAHSALCDRFLVVEKKVMGDGDVVKSEDKPVEDKPEPVDPPADKPVEGKPVEDKPVEEVKPSSDNPVEVPPAAAVL